MKFLHHCFIRKNTANIRLKLREIGYAANPLDDMDMPWIAANYDMFISVRDGYDRLFKSDIDCGDNEILFLAIAAIRMDSDKYQWFTDGEKWIYCEGNSIAGHLAYYDTETNPDKLHKASITELMNHFN